MSHDMLRRHNSVYKQDVNWAAQARHLTPTCRSSSVQDGRYPRPELSPTKP